MIDLCVVNYNTKDLLKRFLDSLHSDVNEQNKIWNLYISDNGSSDGSWPWIEENRTNYHITAGWNNDNIGYSAACNGMASYSSGDIICLLNADVWLTTSDLVSVQNIFDSNPDIHILGPKQRDENGFITHAGIVGTNTAPAHRGWRQHDPNDVLFRDRVPCITVSGSAYFIRRSVWEALRYDSGYAKMYPGALGAFLPTPHYYE
jgi:GT2 family glycosyltransferase